MIYLPEKTQPMIIKFQELAKILTHQMTALKPEKYRSINTRFQDLMLPLDDFKKVVSQETKEPLRNTKIALEHLRKGLLEASDFVDLARNIGSKPSEIIMRILNLREVYGAKEYLSAIPVPETAYLRLIGLRKHLDGLSASIVNLESALEDIKLSVNHLKKETFKYHLLQEDLSKEEIQESITSALKETEA